MWCFIASVKNVRETGEGTLYCVIDHYSLQVRCSASARELTSVQSLKISGSSDIYSNGQIAASIFIIFIVGNILYALFVRRVLIPLDVFVPLVRRVFWLNNRRLFDNTLILITTLAYHSALLKMSPSSFWRTRSKAALSHPPISQDRLPQMDLNQPHLDERNDLLRWQKEDREAWAEIFRFLKARLAIYGLLCNPCSEGFSSPSSIQTWIWEVLAHNKRRVASLSVP